MPRTIYPGPDVCACLGADTYLVSSGMEDMAMCRYCETGVREDLVNNPFFGFGTKPCHVLTKEGYQPDG
jgi:hypothetical protein